MTTGTRTISSTRPSRGLISKTSTIAIVSPGGGVNVAVIVYVPRAGAPALAPGGAVGARRANRQHAPAARRTVRRRGLLHGRDDTRREPHRRDRDHARPRAGERRTEGTRFARGSDDLREGGHEPGACG